jgi:hypothetical protein
MSITAISRSLARLVVDPESGRWTAASVAFNLFSAPFGVEMSNTELSDHQLLDEAKTAIREKDGERAKVLFAGFF